MHGYLPGKNIFVAPDLGVCRVGAEFPRSDPCIRASRGRVPLTSGNACTGGACGVVGQFSAMCDLTNPAPAVHDHHCHPEAGAIVHAAPKGPPPRPPGDVVRRRGSRSAAPEAPSPCTASTPTCGGTLGR